MAEPTDRNQRKRHERITERTLQHLKPPPKGNRILYDGEVPGFGVRITAKAAISFVLKYWLSGRQRCYTIGRYPELSAAAAREEALGLRNRIRKGLDPLAERERLRLENPTMKDLRDEYLRRHAEPNKRPGSVRNDRNMLDNVIVPRLGRLPVAAVSRADVENLHRSLKGTPTQANRVRALLSKAFSLAVQWGWREDNPAHGVSRFPEGSRERWLSAEEVGRLLAVLDQYPDQQAADAIRLILYTGARKSEVLLARWQDFDLEAGRWTKPSHHTKTKRTEHVPLSADALRLLRRVHKEAAGRGGAADWLFAGRQLDPAKRIARLKRKLDAGRMMAQEFEARSKELAELAIGHRENLKTEWAEIRTKAEIQDARLHDLRHTFASHLVSGGESLHVVGRLLGHTQPQTTMRYAHLADEPLREAANHFGKIISKRKRKKA